MKTSIVVPTLNEEGVVGLLLNDLLRQSYDFLEIIVVDAASKDKTVQEVNNLAQKDSRIKCIVSQPPVGGQRTLGGKAAQGELLIFFDADVRLTDSNALQKIVHAIHDKKLHIACPYYMPFKSRFDIKLVYIFFDFLFFLFQKITPSGAGSCIVVKKELFLKCDGFKPDLTYDDIEFIRRASKQGRFGMLPLAITVSDRRFRKYGVLRMFLKYMLLSVFFIFGFFNMANKISYTFANYKKYKKVSE